MRLYKLRNAVLILMMFFVLSLLFVSLGYAASDPSINDWGTPPGTPPPWQTTDIWVDNNGNGIPNEVGEPSKGIKNRLFAKVRNLGTTAANNVTVRFAYAPYGAWGWSSYSDFKEIAVVTGVNLTQSGTPDAEKTIEVEWDLRDLSENNGGIWGGYTVGDFDHFCVWVKIEYPGDSDTTNNKARNNFTNVQTVFGKSYSMKFLVKNPENKDAGAELIIKGIPENWRFAIEGVKDYRKFVLKAGEFKLLTLTFTPPQQPISATQIKQNVDISLKLDNKIIGGISFVATVEKEKPMAFTPSGGVLSPYLIGTFDMRDEARTVLHIINPTAKNLRFMVAFFDDNEKPLKCIHDKLSPNDLSEIDVRRYKLPAKFGVVKVVSLNEKEDMPELGIVGYQRHFFKGIGATETILQPIPAEVLKDDLKYIWKICK
ncbi:MAG: hypothetical protein HY035_01090 [Nitrospirae bacterium]|nr:hypothetical protein [Nitrospirota bacterium]MBI3376985.1 hypothetical protein [Nitrospirota bacterium]